MSLQHLNAFLADVRALNPRIRTAAPAGPFQRASSLLGLITYLQHHAAHPVPLTFDAARQHCANPFDPRLAKYTPALQRLVSVWGRGHHRQYPAANGFVHTPDHRRIAAQQHFIQLLPTVPAPLRPAYHELEDHDDDPWDFTRSLGPGYLRRLVVGGRQLDITARGLLLKAGLGIPVAFLQDNGYAAQLHLGNGALSDLAGRSILDVACGAALFASEMATLFGCTTAGIDLNAASVGPALPEGQRRYVRSMLYLKMLYDQGALQRTTVPAWAGPLIDRLVGQLPAILAHYANHPPVAGDMFNLAATALALRPAGWDVVVSMYALCYFDAADQTEAVLNMCSVARRSVLLFSGIGQVLSPRLCYDQQSVRDAFPGCQIDVQDACTHHIRLR